MTDHIRLAPHAVSLPLLPNDILGEVIDVLAEDEDYETLRNTSLLSPFCLHHCQQHLFRNVEVSTVGSIHSTYKTLQEFTAFFSKHTALLPYIHHFTLHIIYPGTAEPHDSNSLQLYDQKIWSNILLKACNITTLALEVDMEQTQTYLPSFSPSWTSNSFAHIRTLVGNLLRAHQSLVSLSLARISEFPVSMLYIAPRLRHVTLDNTQLIPPPEDIFINPDIGSRVYCVPKTPLPYLETLRIDIMQPSHLQDTTRSLLFQPPNWTTNYALPLYKLKSLHVGLEDSTHCFTAVSEMLQAQTINALEELSIRVPCPIKGSNAAAMLEDLVLSQAQTLRTLVVDVDFAPSYTDDPYLGLCMTLEHLASANKVSCLETIHIMTYVDGELPCPAGEKWGGLKEVLISESKGISRSRIASLKKITLSVVVLYFSGRKRGYGVQLEELRNTHLKELFVRDFVFDLIIQEEWCG